jgi:hypothetical protein
VAAFVHGSEQAGEHDAMQPHGRQHEERAVGEVDRVAADPDSGEVAAKVHEADPVVAPRQGFACFLVDQLERIERHIPAQHGQPASIPRGRITSSRRSKLDNRASRPINQMIFYPL